MTERTFITSHLKEFRETRQILPLLKAIVMILRQGRAIELIYGGYCKVFYRPSPVCLCDDGEALNSILSNRTDFLRLAILTRAQLIELYGNEFDVCSLPRDFESARFQGVCQAGDRLIIGEYGENSRIAYVTPQGCLINDHYRSVPGVRHIHSIVRYGGADKLLITTGDAAKVLDLWIDSGGELRFVRRLRKYLAGFTGAAKVNGGYYFGSDFSGRPNFIGTLDGAKYFFPAKAYKLFVTVFYIFFDRYIVSVNNELKYQEGEGHLPSSMRWRRNLFSVIT
ncbi:MAG: hypothetical protein ACREMZ_07105 [Gemmatimonadales bacterium]